MSASSADAPALPLRHESTAIHAILRLAADDARAIGPMLVLEATQRNAWGDRRYAVCAAAEREAAERAGWTVLNVVLAPDTPWDIPTQATGAGAGQATTPRGGAIR